MGAFVSSHDREQNSQGIHMRVADTSQTLELSPVAPDVFSEGISKNQAEGKVFLVLHLPDCL